MNGALGTADLEHFQSVIARRMGLRFDDGRLTHLAEVLTRRLEARKLGVDAYLTSLASELEPGDELAALARELTVGETYFFRHSAQFSALTEVALPERQSARAASRSLRLLSAGCASGEEAYSLSILLKEQGVVPSFDVSITALDLNPDALARARAGVYSQWSLRETSDERRERWFTREGRDYRLLRAVRESVRFEQRNLSLEAPELAPGTLDVVFCRNMLMYFTTEQAAGLVARLARALAPGGFLFVGHAETLRGLTQAFHLRHTHETFYYQKRDEGPGDVITTSDATPTATNVAVVDRAWVAPWLETVQRASHRIHELTSQRDPDAAPATTAREPQPEARRDLSEPLELLRHERYAEALTALQPPRDDAPDPAAMLLRAALLTHKGDISAAEKACHALLRFDDLNAGAHYLLALCCERRGQLPTAVEHDITAVYLDAGFAMPHLHLGLMARRRRDNDAARHALSQALSLLEREDASRLLLFGGGFSRDALLALCRTELQNLKGRPT